jgi:Domain of unknown function (DUF4136)
MSATRSFRTLIITTVAVLAAGVALAGIDVHVENSPTFDFTTLKTWTMNPNGAGNAVRIISADDKDSTELKKNWETKVLPIVQEGFVKRGFPKATGEPDFYVTCYVLVSVGSSSQQMGQFLRPVPEWGLPYFAPSTSALSVFPQGSLILDIAPRATNDVVWRGVAQAELKWDDTEAKRAQHVRDAVQDLLKKFPPKPAKK